MARYKLSIVVQPLSPLPGVPTAHTGEIRKFLEFADSGVPIAKFWRTIEDRYRKNYLEQAQQATFAIKKIQDEDGNDIDITFTLSDIFQDTPAGKAKILNVIPTRIDRDVSIPVTSDLRPKDAPRRPPVPLFNAQPYLHVNEYANLDPDRPVGSTERELVDGENGREDQEADENDEDEVEDGGAHEGGVTASSRLARSRKDVIDETSEDEQQESHSNSRRDHELDDERRRLPRNNIVEAADRAHAATLTHAPSSSTFAKPILPVTRVGPTHRVGQLREAAGPLQHNSRSVRNAFLSRPSSNNIEVAWKYDSRKPWDLPDSDLHGGAVYGATSKNKNPDIHSDNAFRSGGSSRTSTDSIMSSHPTAMLTPPTSNDGAPLPRDRRNNHSDGLADVSSLALPAINDEQGALRVQQMLQINPATSSGVLSRVQGRPIHSSQPTGLGVPSIAQGSKLRSPFQPHLNQQGGSAAPSSSFDDAGESPLQEPGQSTSAQGLDIQASHHQPTPSVAHSDLNEAADDVEDSMHEDVVRRTAPRRREAGMKRHSRDKPPELDMTIRNGSSPSSSLSKSQSVPPRDARTFQSTKFITPVAPSRQDRSATVPPPRNSPMVPPPRSGIKSTPAQPIQYTPATARNMVNGVPRTSSSTKPVNNSTVLESHSIRKPTLAITPAHATQAGLSNVDGNNVSPEWPRDYSFSSEVLQSLSTQAIRDVDNERALESTAATGDDAMDISPTNDISQQAGMVKRLVSSAEAQADAEVRKFRDRHTLSWLKAQQEGDHSTLDRMTASASSVNMSRARDAARQRNEADDTDPRRKKPDPKGKRRAVPTLEDRELLKSAGEPVSDERMDIDNNSDLQRLESAAQDDFIHSPSGTRKSVYEKIHVPFAVVIDGPQKSPPTSNMVTSPARSSRLIESTPSQEIPTSAQPIQRTSATVPASAPSTQQRVSACPDCRRLHRRCPHGSSSQSSASIPQPSSPTLAREITKASTTNPKISNKTPSQEHFAFLPEKPGPDPPKRKRKNPASSPIENLASELHQHRPDRKKRKVHTTGNISNIKNVKCSVALPNGEFCPRPLTCSVHKILERRAVRGRDAPFDELLARSKEQAKASTRKSSYGSSPHEPIVVPSDAEVGRPQQKKPPPHQGRAQTVVPEPVQLMSDADRPHKQSLSPSRSRRAATAAPASSPRRRSITSRPSLVSAQYPIVIEPSDVEAETRQFRSPSRSRRAASAVVSPPRRHSSQASSRRDVVMLDGAADSISPTSDGTQSKNETTPNPANEEDMDIDVGGGDMQAGSTAGSTVLSQMEKSASPSLSLSHQLDAELQSSAHSRHSQEQRGKYNVLATKPLSPPPMSFPTQSSQPSQPSLTSTTRSPESSPERLSDQADSLTPVPRYKQRSSSPEWLTPQWVREKEEREERRRLESASQALPTLTPSRTPRLSVREDHLLHPKAKDTMPPPAFSTPKIPQTPLKSILKRNSTSSTSASQPVRRVSIDPAVEQFPSGFSYATQPTSKTTGEGVPTMSTIMARPEYSPPKIDEHNALEASPLMSDHTIQDTKARVAALQLEPDSAIEDEEDDSSDDGDIEDNEVGSGSEDDEDESASDVDDMAEAQGQIDQPESDVGSDESDLGHETEQSVTKPAADQLNSTVQVVAEKGKDDSDDSDSDSEADEAVTTPSPARSQPEAQTALEESADDSDDSATESEHEEPVLEGSPEPVDAHSSVKIAKPSSSPTKSPVRGAGTPSSPVKSPAKSLKTPSRAAKSPDDQSETISSPAKTKGPTNPAKPIRELFVPPYESEFKIPLGPRPPQPIAPRYRFTAASSQPTTSIQTQNHSRKPISASSPLRAAAKTTDDTSDDDTSSDDSESGYSHASDVPEEVEAEVARRMAANPREKIGQVRGLVKWYLRQDRVEQRRRDKQEAEEKAKLEKYRQTVFGNANTDPWAEERAEREAKKKLVGRRRKSDNYD